MLQQCCHYFLSNPCIILKGRCDTIVLNVHAPTENTNDLTSIKDRFYEELEHVFDKFRKYHRKILLDFIAKVGKEDIFKPTTGNESLHEISNANAVREVNFADIQKSYQKYDVATLSTFIIFTSTFPDGKMRNQIDHILIARTWHSSILDV
jgi:hypothetical protein